MELMHDFVKGCVYCISGKYTYLEDTDYFVCDARVNGRLSITSRISRGPHSRAGYVEEGDKIYVLSIH